MTDPDELVNSLAATQIAQGILLADGLGREREIFDLVIAIIGWEVADEAGESLHAAASRSSW
jgi:hypothetical protein